MMPPIAPPPGLEGRSLKPGFGTSEAHSMPLPSPLAEEVRQKVMKDLEIEVGMRLQGVLKKGAESVKQVQQESDLNFEELGKQVTEFHAAQDALEAENRRLKEVIATLGNQLSMVGAAFGDLWGVPGCINQQTATAAALAAMATLGCEPSIPQGAGQTDGSMLPGLPADSVLQRALSECIIGAPSLTTACSQALASPSTQGLFLSPESAVMGSPAHDPLEMPLHAAMEDSWCLGEAQLPEVPAFPFPTQSWPPQPPQAPPPPSPQAAAPPPPPFAPGCATPTTGPAAPPAPPPFAPGCGTPKTGPSISLADALGLHSPDSLPPAPPLPAPHEDALNAAIETSAALGLDEEAEAFIFSVTLRVAASSDLGLTTSQNREGPRSLTVEAVLPRSAAEAWNRQCGTSGSTERMLLPGDRIVRVNDAADDPTKMLQEMAAQKLLKFQILRTSDDLPPAAATSTLVSPPAPSITGSKLRVDASVFVPMGTMVA